MENKILQGKVVLITGAVQGIGKSIAEKFANQGASIIISDVQDGEKIAKTMQDKGNDVLFCKTDLRKEKEIQKLIQFVIDKRKVLNVIVNNARPKLEVLSFTESMKEWDLAMDVLLKGPALLCKYGLPHLEKSKGCVINIASTNAFTVSHQPVAYHVAKAGLVHLTRCLAQEFGPKGVRVNAICPGLVDLDDREKSLTSNPVNKALVESIVPLKRASTPEDIAELAFFLCSKASNYITGQGIILDGGLGVKDPFYIAQKSFYKGKNE